MGRDGRAERGMRWRGVLDRQRASGQSLRRFCLLNKITETALYNWRRERASPTSSRPAAAIVKSPEGSSRRTPFPLNIQAVIPAASPIEVIHPRGHLLRVPPSFDAESLQRRLNTLSQWLPY